MSVHQREKGNKNERSCLIIENTISLWNDQKSRGTTRRNFDTIDYLLMRKMLKYGMNKYKEDRKWEAKKKKKKWVNASELSENQLSRSRKAKGKMIQLMRACQRITTIIIDVHVNFFWIKNLISNHVTTCRLNIKQNQNI